MARQGNEGHTQGRARQGRVKQGPGMLPAWLREQASKQAAPRLLCPPPSRWPVALQPKIRTPSEEFSIPLPAGLDPLALRSPAARACPSAAGCALLRDLVRGHQSSRRSNKLRARTPVRPWKMVFLARAGDEKRLGRRADTQRRPRSSQARRARPPDRGGASILDFWKIRKIHRRPRFGQAGRGGAAGGRPEVRRCVPAFSRRASLALARSPASELVDEPSRAKSHARTLARSAPRLHQLARRPSRPACAASALQARGRQPPLPSKPAGRQPGRQEEQACAAMRRDRIIAAARPLARPVLRDEDATTASIATTRPKTRPASLR
ncbi:uncharacterized protein PSFLO_02091 [Pseudozyma flocculosa]|uniref:Uncharacterized protein n=1 Tax=Pseudozyma flocculosa TaxID=84751 RepID=A0A5C3EXM7_9BASI|nr:uncharacterized protein PSFLO_02091 [Pseudozyma flocculosa]